MGDKGEELAEVIRNASIYPAGEFAGRRECGKRSGGGEEHVRLGWQERERRERDDRRSVELDRVTASAATCPSD